MTDAPVQDRTLPRLLASKSAARKSGIVTAQRGKLRRIFCLESGWIVYAASNLLEEQLDEFLVRNGLIQPADRAEAALEAKKEGTSTIAVLRDRELTPEAALRRGMEGLIETLLSSCLEWPDGEYRFAAGRPKLEGEVTVRVSPVSLVLNHARRFPASLDAVRVRIGPPDFCPQRTEEGEHLAEVLQTSGAIEFLLGTCDGTVSIGELVGQSPEDEERTLRAAYGLLLLGALDRPTEGARAAKARRKKEPELSIDECVAVLQRAKDADHYTVLGLTPRATRAQIRDAYYSLARRYHPDRFRSGPLLKLLEQMEAYFTHVTQAYNTLYTPDLRKTYDEHLAAAAPTTAPEVQTEVLARQNFLKAKQLIERGRLSEAVTFLENALQLDDSRAEYHLELGVVLAGNPRMRAEAEEHLLRAVDIDPTRAVAYLTLGQIYRKAARDAEAARMFRETLRWQPENREAADELSELGPVADEAGASGAFRHLFRS